MGFFAQRMRKRQLHVFPRSAQKSRRPSEIQLSLFGLTKNSQLWRAFFPKVLLMMIGRAVARGEPIHVPVKPNSLPASSS